MKKRLFIAVDISQQARELAADYMHEMSRQFPDARVKWERPEKLHLTVKFLGSTEENLIEKLKKLVGRNASLIRPFEITIAGTGSFPSAKSPRVLWLGVSERTGELKRLATGIDADCARLGFEPEKRSFKPHLTLARSRDPRGAENLGREHAERRFGPITYNCCEAVLYESHLGRSGSTYSKLLTAKFADS